MYANVRTCKRFAFENTEDTATYTTKQYIMDGHGSVTALAETNETGTVVTDTYTYDAYGTLLKKTGTTDNDYLYTGEQYNEATVEGLAKAIAKGMITQALLNCALTKVLGKAANTVIKLIGIAQDTGSFIEAVKSGDPERIMVESLRLVVSLYTLKCECFTGETLVSTTEGDKRIDEIKIGDYVYAYDTEKEENVPAKVTYVSISETDILVHVYTSGGEEIKTTMFHPFYVKNVKNGEDETYGIWKASANLVAGDELLTDDGRVVYVEEVRIERLAESVKVYNLEVEGLHTYYVGSGVLVHNDYAKGNSSSESGSKSSYPQMDLDNLPQNVQDSFHKYDKAGWKGNVSGQAPGTNAGRKWRNKKGQLPQYDANGNPITYREFDVNDYNGVQRDSERFIVGDDGSVWYSDSHYGEGISLNGIADFVQIR